MKLVLFAALCLLASQGFSETLVFEGDIQSDGTPTEAIELTLDKKYNMVLSGTVNTGKWHQGGMALGEDACFDFGDHVHPVPNELVKNSLDIDFCGDGLYHSDHVYHVKSYTAKQNRIHFWVNDDDYSDNTGSFKIKIYEQ